MSPKKNPKKKNKQFNKANPYKNKSIIQYRQRFYVAASIINVIHLRCPQVQMLLCELLQSRRFTPQKFIMAQYSEGGYTNTLIRIVKIHCKYIQGIHHFCCFKLWMCSLNIAERFGSRPNIKAAVSNKQL